MTIFLIGAVLLTVCALFFVLPPLLREQSSREQHVRRDDLNLAVLRDQLRELDADLEVGVIDPEAYKNARQDIERRVAEEVQPQEHIASASRQMPWSTWVVGASVPVLAVSVYLLVGSPDALDPAKAAAASQESAHALTPEQIEGMVEGLAQRMKSDPDNAEGWNMLARSYNALGHYGKAAQAYEQLVRLVPNDANLLADYADTLAMASNKTLQGAPEQVIDRALAVDPNNLKALALSGSAAFERRDYANAIVRWQKIVALVPPDSEIARSTNSSITEAQRAMGTVPALGAATQQQQAAGGASKAAVTGATVQGIVELDPALRGQVADTDTVFIFARAAQGPRFPLAVLRKQVKDLPVTFVLDDSMAMMPEATLSSVPMVVVGARISKSGSATPAAGDLEGVIAPVAPGAKNLKIRIDKRNG